MDRSATRALADVTAQVDAEVEAAMGIEENDDDDRSSPLSKKRRT